MTQAADFLARLGFRLPMVGRGGSDQDAQKNQYETLDHWETMSGMPGPRKLRVIVGPSLHDRPKLPDSRACGHDHSLRMICRKLQSSRSTSPSASRSAQVQRPSTGPPLTPVTQSRKAP